MPNFLVVAATPLFQDQLLAVYGWRILCLGEQIPRPPLYISRQWGDIKLPPPYVSGAGLSARDTRGMPVVGD